MDICAEKNVTCFHRVTPHCFFFLFVSEESLTSAIWFFFFIYNIYMVIWLWLTISTLRSRGLYVFFLFFFFVFKSEGERCTTSWTPHLPSGGQQEGRSWWERDCWFSPPHHHWSCPTGLWSNWECPRETSRAGLRCQLLTARCRSSDSDQCGLGRGENPRRIRSGSEKSPASASWERQSLTDLVQRND